MKKKPVQMRLMEPRAGYGKKEQEPFVPSSNPKLSEFIRKNSKPFDPADGGRIRPFEKDLAGHKTNPLYTLHPYWSKKDPVLIQEYIRHYTDPGDLVLDPFGGSGTTVLSALIEGRSCVLVDVSPSAALINHFYCLAAHPDDVDSAFQGIMDKVGTSIDELFATRCDRCEGDAIIEFVVLSEQYQCPRCGDVVALYDCPEVKVPYPVGGKKSARIELKKRRVCPTFFVQDLRCHRRRATGSA